MAEERTPSRCDQCGKVDTHPKSHWNTGEVYHHDCLPYDKREEFADSHPLAQSILDASASGKTGNALLAHIVEIHKES